MTQQSIRQEQSCPCERRAPPSPLLPERSHLMPDGSRSLCTRSSPSPSTHRSSPSTSTAGWLERAPPATVSNGGWDLLFQPFLEVSVELTAALHRQAAGDKAPTVVRNRGKGVTVCMGPSGSRARPWGSRAQQDELASHAPDPGCRGPSFPRGGKPAAQTSRLPAQWHPSVDSRPEPCPAAATPPLQHSWGLASPSARQHCERRRAPLGEHGGAAAGSRITSRPRAARLRDTPSPPNSGLQQHPPTEVHMSPQRNPCLCSNLRGKARASERSRETRPDSGSSPAASARPSTPKSPPRQL